MDLAKLDKLISESNFNIKSVSTIEDFDNETIKNRVKTIKKYKKQLEKLFKVPKIEQKTEAWYTAREGMISASDFAQALGEGKFGSKKQLIQKKCEPVNESGFSMTNPFFKWGNMFESVANDIYAIINNVEVHEFGLIKHPVHSFFGASPDGITANGIMVEIKCPFKRKITGEIPRQYYYQMQGQLDVCELDECDYIECEFGVYTSLDEFRKNFSNHEFKGIIIETSPCKFEYSKVITDNDFSKVTSFIENKRNIQYWYLKKHFISRVIRDKEFLKEKLGELKEVWNSILFYRQNKEKYIVEILNSVTIETDPLFPPELNKPEEPEHPFKKGFAFRELL
jgi:putative phage-type endonuclease